MKNSMMSENALDHWKSHRKARDSFNACNLVKQEQISAIDWSFMTWRMPEESHQNQCWGTFFIHHNSDFVPALDKFQCLTGSGQARNEGTATLLDLDRSAWTRWDLINQWMSGVVSAVQKDESLRILLHRSQTRPYAIDELLIRPIRIDRHLLSLGLLRPATVESRRTPLQHSFQMLKSWTLDSNLYGDQIFSHLARQRTSHRPTFSASRSHTSSLIAAWTSTNHRTYTLIHSKAYSQARVRSHE